LTDPAEMTTGAAFRLPELLLSEELRLYAQNGARMRMGWLTALREPIVCRALLELHADPRHKWMVEELARRVASSHLTLNECFGELLGRPPMQYLSEWRLQLVAGLLWTTDDSAAMVAYRVDYESEASFNRAVKRAMGSPPRSGVTRSKRTGCRQAVMQERSRWVSRISACSSSPLSH
jgi:transcriptional regulator GlxA family with amidase domain